jgi:hypothetical protein
LVEPTIIKDTITLEKPKPETQEEEDRLFSVTEAGVLIEKNEGEDQG